jgi:hypothetical protein
MPGEIPHMVNQLGGLMPVPDNLVLSQQNLPNSTVGLRITPKKVMIIRTERKRRWRNLFRSRVETKVLADRPLDMRTGDELTLRATVLYTHDASPMDVYQVVRTRGDRRRILFEHRELRK